MNSSGALICFSGAPTWLLIAVLHHREGSPDKRSPSGALSLTPLTQVRRAALPALQASRSSVTPVQTKVCRRSNNEHIPAALHVFCAQNACVTAVVQARLGHPLSAVCRTACLEFFTRHPAQARMRGSALEHSGECSRFD